jgi:hypothetical protein
MGHGQKRELELQKTPFQTCILMNNVSGTVLLNQPLDQSGDGTDGSSDHVAPEEQVCDAVRECSSLGMQDGVHVVTSDFDHLLPPIMIISTS